MSKIRQHILKSYCKPFRMKNYNKSNKLMYHRKHVNVLAEFLKISTLYSPRSNKNVSKDQQTTVFELTWYCSSVSISPRTATTWYWWALIADGPLRISLKESWDDPNAATCLGPWLGSNTKRVIPVARCSTPIIVREWPGSVWRFVLLGGNVR